MNHFCFLYYILIATVCDVVTPNGEILLNIKETSTKVQS